MSWRQLPPVSSPIPVRALVDGIGAAIGLLPAGNEIVAAALRRRYGAVDALLTDSGTSALILALRKLVPLGGTVAYPAYSCIDLTSAAVGAGVRVRLYDLDPVTLSPDLSSVRKAIARGVDAIVVAHLYGYPADVIGVRALAQSEGIPVIEDAAQGAGGRIDGLQLGSLGDVSILSFARGKGTTGGSGGALLTKTPAFRDWTGATRAGLTFSRGGIEVLNLTAQRVLSHPWIYRVPSSIPALRLGEMVYREPRRPRGMSRVSVAVLRRTLDVEDLQVSARRNRAANLLSCLDRTAAATPVRSIPGSESGFLRLAFLDAAGSMSPRSDLGALRGYPMTLGEHPQLRPLLHPGEKAGTGATFLRDRLFTVPTHAGVSDADVARLAVWLNGETAALPARPAFV
ncbi:MAG TPA: DegT/DnrJ/EryC1/StrS family aminotransferase [Gemmatimonadaceae bacterium]|nr:DegT/DnrJ/EryC1/StrS family aminotransferase [Gemmatimonadaceae bacterium]